MVPAILKSVLDYGISFHGVITIVYWGSKGLAEHVRYGL